jgi:serine/threonine protein kinase
MVYDPVHVYEPEWKAPEVLMGTSGADQACASDVYTLGLVLYSIITRAALFEFNNPMILGYLIALHGLTPEIPEFIPQKLVIIIKIDTNNQVMLGSRCCSKTKHCSAS